MGDSFSCNPGLNEISSASQKRSASSVAIKTTLAEADRVSVPTMAVGSKMLISDIYHPIFKLMIDRLGWVIWDLSGKILLMGGLTFRCGSDNFFYY